MPNAPIHFITGMGFGVIASLIIYSFKKDSLKFLPLVIIFFGIWSMIPDLPQFTAAKLDTNFIVERSFTHTPPFNIFCLHPFIDTRIGHDYDETLDFWMMLTIAWILAMICTMYAITKERQREE